MTRSYEYSVVDVFAETALEGNPLGVFLDADGLDDQKMQALARELNLSETTFVSPARNPECLARVRIFTPGKELPFAGHPTIGTAYALVHAGRVPIGTDRFLLEEGIGSVPLHLERRDPFFAWLRTPPIRFGKQADAARCARALGLDATDVIADVPPQEVGAGNPFLFVALRSPESVDRAALNASAMPWPSDETNGVFLFAAQPGGVYARMLAAESTGIAEDPATGSATGPLGAYLAEYGMLERRDGVRFLNEQGVKMRRRSHIHGILRYREGSLETVEVGGGAIGVIRATVSF